MGVGHDWNSALYFLEKQIENHLKPAYDAFILEKTEENANNFADAVKECSLGMEQAKHAMWYSWIAEEYDKANLL